MVCAYLAVACPKVTAGSLFLWKYLSGGNHLQVPYRTLVPCLATGQVVDGLLVAGRCISVDDGLIGPIRVIPPCMMTGQAAGAAAALSAREGVAPRELDAGQLREALDGAGVILPAADD
jgi:hypothetical protein